METSSSILVKSKQSRPIVNSTDCLEARRGTVMPLIQRIEGLCQKFWFNQLLNLPVPLPYRKEGSRKESSPHLYARTLILFFSEQSEDRSAVSDQSLCRFWWGFYGINSIEWTIEEEDWFHLEWPHWKTLLWRKTSFSLWRFIKDLCLCLLQKSLLTFGFGIHSTGFIVQIIQKSLCDWISPSRDFETKERELCNDERQMLWSED